MSAIQDVPQGRWISAAHAMNSEATTAEQCARSAETDSAGVGGSFSRSTGLPARMGKSTAELKTKVPECVKDAFTALSHALGLTESELLRSMVMVRLYGVEGAERMHSNQLRAAAGMGPLSAPIANAD